MKALALICACWMLCACGNTGALYLPEKRSTEAPPANAPTPSMDPAADPEKKKDPPPPKQ